MRAAVQRPGEGSEASELDLRVLGPLEIWRAGTRQTLPRSKKTRALLAYLALTGKPHFRDRLCDLFWDLTDDPRGALRWSLSRLRRAIDWDEPRITTTREEIALNTAGMRIDATELSHCVQRDVREATTEELEALASLPRGAFLEGLELAELMDFSAWCVGQRERLRDEHCTVLAELVSRLIDDPPRALKLRLMTR